MADDMDGTCYNTATNDTDTEQEVADVLLQAIQQELLFESAVNKCQQLWNNSNSEATIEEDYMTTSEDSSSGYSSDERPANYANYASEKTSNYANYAEEKTTNYANYAEERTTNHAGEIYVGGPRQIIFEEIGVFFREYIESGNEILIGDLQNAFLRFVYTLTQKVYDRIVTRLTPEQLEINIFKMFLEKCKETC